MYVLNFLIIISLSLSRASERRAKKNMLNSTVNKSNRRLIFHPKEISIRRERKSAGLLMRMVYVSIDRGKHAHWHVCQNVGFSLYFFSCSGIAVALGTHVDRRYKHLPIFVMKFSSEFTYAVTGNRVRDNEFLFRSKF